MASEVSNKLRDNPFLMIGINTIIVIVGYFLSSIMLDQKDINKDFQKHIEKMATKEEVEARFKNHEQYESRNFEAIKEIILLSSSRTEALIESTKESYESIDKRLGRLEGRVDNIKK